MRGQNRVKAKAAGRIPGYDRRLVSSPERGLREPVLGGSIGKTPGTFWTTCAHP